MIKVTQIYPIKRVFDGNKNVKYYIHSLSTYISLKKQYEFKRGTLLYNTIITLLYSITTLCACCYSINNITFGKLFETLFCQRIIDNNRH